jgi:hypothetical protein
MLPCLSQMSDTAMHLTSSTCTYYMKSQTSNKIINIMQTCWTGNMWFMLPVLSNLLNWQTLIRIQRSCHNAIVHQIWSSMLTTNFSHWNAIWNYVNHCIMFLLHIKQYSFGVQFNKPWNFVQHSHVFSLKSDTNTLPYVLTLASQIGWVNKWGSCL